MHHHVYWVLELTVHEGQDDAFAALMHEMIAATRANEPGALNYEWSFSEDGRRCHVFERYVDSDATMTHLAAFGRHFAERFTAMTTVDRFTVYGHANDTVRAAPAPFGATFLNPVDGFAR